MGLPLTPGNLRAVIKRKTKELKNGSGVKDESEASEYDYELKHSDTGSEEHEKCGTHSRVSRKDKLQTEHVKRKHKSHKHRRRKSSSRKLKKKKHKTLDKLINKTGSRKEKKHSKDASSDDNETRDLTECDKLKATNDRNQSTLSDSQCFQNETSNHKTHRNKSREKRNVKEDASSDRAEESEIPRRGHHEKKLKETASTSSKIGDPDYSKKAARGLVEKPNDCTLNKMEKQKSKENSYVAERKDEKNERTQRNVRPKRIDDAEITKTTESGVSEPPKTGSDEILENNCKPRKEKKDNNLKTRKPREKSNARDNPSNEPETAKPHTYGLRSKKPDQSDKSNKSPEVIERSAKAKKKEDLNFIRAEQEKFGNESPIDMAAISHLTEMITNKIRCKEVEKCPETTNVCSSVSVENQVKNITLVHFKKKCIQALGDEDTTTLDNICESLIENDVIRREYVESIESANTNTMIQTALKKVISSSVKVPDKCILKNAEVSMSQRSGEINTTADPTTINFSDVNKNIVTLNLNNNCTFTEQNFESHRESNVTECYNTSTENLQEKPTNCNKQFQIIETANPTQIIYLINNSSSRTNINRHQENRGHEHLNCSTRHIVEQPDNVERQLQIIESRNAERGLHLNNNYLSIEKNTDQQDIGVREYPNYSTTHMVEQPVNVDRQLQIIESRNAKRHLNNNCASIQQTRDQQDIGVREYPSYSSTRMVEQPVNVDKHLQIVESRNAERELHLNNNCASIQQTRGQQDIGVREYPNYSTTRMVEQPDNVGRQLQIIASRNAERESHLNNNYLSIQKSTDQQDILVREYPNYSTTRMLEQPDNVDKHLQIMESRNTERELHLNNNCASIQQTRDPQDIGVRSYPSYSSTCMVEQPVNVDKHLQIVESRNAERELHLNNNCASIQQTRGQQDIVVREYPTYLTTHMIEQPDNVERQLQIFASRNAERESHLNNNYLSIQKSTDQQDIVVHEYPNYSTTRMLEQPDNVDKHLQIMESRNTERELHLNNNCVSIQQTRGQQDIGVREYPNYSTRSMVEQPVNIDRQLQIFESRNAERELRLNNNCTSIQKCTRQEDIGVREYPNFSNRRIVEQPVNVDRQLQTIESRNAERELHLNNNCASIQQGRRQQDVGVREYPTYSTRMVEQPVNVDRQVQTIESRNAERELHLNNNCASIQKCIGQEDIGIRDYPTYSTARMVEQAVNVDRQLQTIEQRNTERKLHLNNNCLSIQKCTGQEDIGIREYPTYSTARMVEQPVNVDRQLQTIESRNAERELHLNNNCASIQQCTGHEDFGVREYPTYSTARIVEQPVNLDRQLQIFESRNAEKELHLNNNCASIPQTRGQQDIVVREYPSYSSTRMVEQPVNVDRQLQIIDSRNTERELQLNNNFSTIQQSAGQQEICACHYRNCSTTRMVEQPVNVDKHLQIMDSKYAERELHLNNNCASIQQTRGQQDIVVREYPSYSTTRMVEQPVNVDRQLQIIESRNTERELQLNNNFSTIQQSASQQEICACHYRNCSTTRMVEQPVNVDKHLQIMKSRNTERELHLNNNCTSIQQSRGQQDIGIREYPNCSTRMVEQPVNVDKHLQIMESRNTERELHLINNCASIQQTRDQQDIGVREYSNYSTRMVEQPVNVDKHLQIMESRNTERELHLNNNCASIQQTRDQQDIGVREYPSYSSTRMVEQPVNVDKHLQIMKSRNTERELHLNNNCTSIQQSRGQQDIGIREYPNCSTRMVEQPVNVDKHLQIMESRNTERELHLNNNCALIQQTRDQQDIGVREYPSYSSTRLVEQPVNVDKHLQIMESRNTERELHLNNNCASIQQTRDQQDIGVREYSNYSTRMVEQPGNVDKHLQIVESRNTERELHLNNNCASIQQTRDQQDIGVREYPTYSARMVEQPVNVDKHLQIVESRNTERELHLNNNCASIQQTIGQQDIGVREYPTYSTRMVEQPVNVDKHLQIVESRNTERELHLNNNCASIQQTRGQQDIGVREYPTCSTAHMIEQPVNVDKHLQIMKSRNTERELHLNNNCASIQQTRDQQDIGVRKYPNYSTRMVEQSVNVDRQLQIIEPENTEDELQVDNNCSSIHQDTGQQESIVSEFFSNSTSELEFDAAINLELNNNGNAEDSIGFDDFTFTETNDESQESISNCSYNDTSSLTAPLMNYEIRKETNTFVFADQNDESQQESLFSSCPSNKTLDIAKIVEAIDFNEDFIFAEENDESQQEGSITLYSKDSSSQISINCNALRGLIGDRNTTEAIDVDESCTFVEENEENQQKNTSLEGLQMTKQKVIGKTGFSSIENKYLNEEKENTNNNQYKRKRHKKASTKNDDNSPNKKRKVTQKESVTQGDVGNVKEIDVGKTKGNKFQRASNDHQHNKNKMDILKRAGEDEVNNILKESNNRQDRLFQLLLDAEIIEKEDGVDDSELVFIGERPGIIQKVPKRQDNIDLNNKTSKEKSSRPEHLQMADRNIIQKALGSLQDGNRASILNSNSGSVEINLNSDDDLDTTEYCPVPEKTVSANITKKKFRNSKEKEKRKSGNKRFRSSEIAEELIDDPGTIPIKKAKFNIVSQDKALKQDKPKRIINRSRKFKQTNFDAKIEPQTIHFEVIPETYKPMVDNRRNRTVLNIGQTAAELKLQCECELEFDSASALLQHAKLQHYECDVCSKQFTDVKLLKEHAAQYDAKFVCSVCRKVYNNRTSLYIHQRNHFPGKAYECDICGKTFPRVDNLTRHVKGHAQERTERCDRCGQTFAQLASLRRHLKEHDRTALHQCPYCDFTNTFTQKSNLVRHIRRMHDSRYMMDN